MSTLAAGFMVATVSLSLSSFAVAQLPMHVPEPTVNLGDTSFLDARGGPGVLLEEIGDGYYAGASVDASGQVADRSATNSVSFTTHGVLLTSHRLFGAFYGVEILGVVGHVNAGGKGAAGGAGDLTVSPSFCNGNSKRLAACICINALSSIQSCRSADMTGPPG